jgi:hypothetical protein
VRFGADEDPVYVGYCHCSDCRRATGAPVSAFVGFPSDRVTFAGEPATYVNGPVRRNFCAKCGSPIAYFDRRVGDSIYFYLGAMDEPQNYKPTLHAFASEKLPFLHIPDGLPRMEKNSVERPR